MGRYLDLAKQERDGHQTAVVEIPSTPPTESAAAPEIIRVSYQRIFYDWDLADGSYSPEQLRKAKLVVKPWGPVQTYTLDGAVRAVGINGGTREP